MITKLCCAKQGNSCEVISVEGKDRNRLAELGFNKGTTVRVIKHNPILIGVKDSHIALRHSEAESITVEIK